MVWLEKKRKSNLIYKTTMEQVGTLGVAYIRNEDPNFKNSIIDIVNSRSDLRKFLLATSDYE